MEIGRIRAQEGRSKEKDRSLKGKSLWCRNGDIEASAQRTKRRKPKQSRVFL